MKFLYTIFLSTLLISCYSESKKKDRTDDLLAKSDSLAARLQESGDKLDSITTLTVEQATRKINYLNNAKDTYRKKIEDIRSSSDDLIKDKDKQIANLQSAINNADKTITELKEQIKTLNSKIYQDSLSNSKTKSKLDNANTELEKIKKGKKDKDVDDENIIGGPNNLLLNLVETKRVKSENLNIYLIPYSNSKEVKDLMNYEISCNEYNIRKIKGYKVAKISRGIYFFKNVDPGKYLLKICTYYGNYQVINKVNGQQTITLMIAPPVQ